MYHAIKSLNAMSINTSTSHKEYNYVPELRLDVVELLLQVAEPKS